MKEIMLPHLVEWFENEFRLRVKGGGGVRRVKTATRGKGQGKI